MPRVEEFSCLVCEASILVVPTDLASKGWFKPRTALNSQSYCPAHVPSWVGAWREKREAKAKYREDYALKSERIELANAVLASASRWHIELTWPTAWDEKGAFFDLAEEEAARLNGGTYGGGIMTGSPLYNSPSNLAIGFTSEAEALAFIDFTRQYFKPRRHNNCDVRFWELKLEHIVTYDVDQSL